MNCGSAPCFLAIFHPFSVSAYSHLGISQSRDISVLFWLLSVSLSSWTSAVFIFLLKSIRQSLSYKHQVCKRHLIISLQSSHSLWSLEGDDNPSRVLSFNLALVYARLLQECVFLNLLLTLILLLAPNISFPHSRVEVPRSKPTFKSKKNHRRSARLPARAPPNKQHVGGMSTPIIPQPRHSCFCLPRDLI